MKLLRVYPVTTVLFAVNLFIFVGGVMTGTHGMHVSRFALSASALAQHWEVLLTAGFLHSDLGHLLYNLLFLWIFGQSCEEAFGSAKTVAVYVVSLLSGNLFFLLLFPENAAIGASGAIAGLIAAAILVEPGRPVVPDTDTFPVALLALAFLLPTALNAFNLAGNTANIAHVGGAFGGAVLALVWERETAIEHVKDLWLVWAFIGGVVLVTLLLVLRAL